MKITGANNGIEPFSLRLHNGISGTLHIAEREAAARIAITHLAECLGRLRVNLADDGIRTRTRSTKFSRSPSLNRKRGVNSVFGKMCSTLPVSGAFVRPV